MVKPILSDPFWNERVEITTELIFSYQLEVKSRETVLKEDREKLAATHQFQDVRNQLDELLIESDINDISKLLFDYDEFAVESCDDDTSAEESAGELDSNYLKEKHMKKKDHLEKLNMFLEADAPFPMPNSPKLALKNIDGSCYHKTQEPEMYSWNLSESASSRSSVDGMDGREVAAPCPGEEPWMRNNQGNTRTPANKRQRVAVITRNPQDTRGHTGPEENPAVAGQDVKVVNEVGECHDGGSPSEEPTTDGGRVGASEVCQERSLTYGISPSEGQEVNLPQEGGKERILKTLHSISEGQNVIGGQNEVFPTSGGQSERSLTVEGQNNMSSTSENQVEMSPALQGQTEMSQTSEGLDEMTLTSGGQNEMSLTCGGQNELSPASEGPNEVSSSSEPTSGGQNEMSEISEGQNEMSETSEGQNEMTLTSGVQNEMSQTSDGQNEMSLTSEGQNEMSLTPEGQNERSQASDGQNEMALTTGGQNEVCQASEGQDEVSSASEPVVEGTSPNKSREATPSTSMSEDIVTMKSGDVSMSSVFSELNVEQSTVGTNSSDLDL